MSTNKENHQRLNVRLPPGISVSRVLQRRVVSIHRKDGGI
jgi:hypothetical protein